jgi:GT2 family glycosyltransferase
MLDVSIVTYESEIAKLRELADSIAEASTATKLSIFIHDNSARPDAASAFRDALLADGRFARVELAHTGENVGFGAAHNANATLGTAPFFFVVNPDCVLEPGALATLLEVARADEARVAAWEMRQLPYEHPKAYDPVTLETGWTSGAATLYRRRDFEAVGGFDPAIFLYGEDVDLSWRLRARGSILRYVPKAAVVHDTYSHPGEVKPQQLFGSAYANLALRTRYGGIRSIAKGALLWAVESCAAESFPGRRRGIREAGRRFLRHARHFRATRVRPNEHFRPIFRGWSYELRRDGPFQAMRSRRGRPASDFPQVSILVRTTARPAWLRQALESCANQTYPNLEVVVVEDGAPTSQATVQAFAGRLDVRYLATGTHVGRARAGNIALQQARGEWLNFLDDDDLLFADHVEALVDAARTSRTPGAYGFAWQSATRVIDRERAIYEEVADEPIHRAAFDRGRLWYQNYLPIQSVLFHRSLYERHGGFAEDMDQLEDWNLWTRYTLEADFVAVPKTTSKYRVPADKGEARGRQERLNAAYADAVARQRSLRAGLSPQRLSEIEAGADRARRGGGRLRSLARQMVHSSRVLSLLMGWRNEWVRERRSWR